MINYTLFGNYTLCLYFLDPLQNQCIFQQSLAKIVYTLEITCKEIVSILCLSWGSEISLECQINMNLLNSYEMIMYFSNWPENAYFINFHWNIFILLSLVCFIKNAWHCPYACVILHILIISSFYKVQHFWPICTFIPLWGGKNQFR